MSVIRFEYTLAEQEHQSWVLLKKERSGVCRCIRYKIKSRTEVIRRKDIYRAAWFK